MADGTIKFDTELNTDGLVSDLAGAAQSSKSALGGLSQAVNSEIGEMFTKIAREAGEQSKSIATDAIAAQKLYEEETKRIQNSKKNSEALYLDALKENVEQIKALRDEELKSLKTSYDLGLINAQEYFGALGNWRDRYFEYGSTGWQTYTAEILKYNKKLTDEQEKALSDAAKAVSENISKQYDELLKQQEKLQSKLADFGGISSKNRLVGEDVDIKFTSIADMNAQIAALQEYERLLSGVQDRVNDFWRTDTGDAATDEKNAALRSSYFTQMRSMSVDDAVDFANALMGTTDSKFAEYLSGYEMKQNLARQISKSLFSDEIQDTADSAARRLGTDFTSALADELEGLSGKFFSSGEEACKSFGEGFMMSLDEMLKGLSAQISTGASALLSGNSIAGASTNIENNTSYNVYGAASPENTIRMLREREEMKQLMMEG